MIPLRTELQIPPSSLRITHGSRIFTTGSCFSDDLGRWLSDNKFRCSVNPFGTTYNPISIHRAMTHALRQTPVDEKKIVTSNDLHYHFDFHSKWASPDATTLKKQLQLLNQEAAAWLNTSDVIIITYGTAWFSRRRR